MADATVLNTVGLCPCGFESRLRHVVGSLPALEAAPAAGEALAAVGDREPTGDGLDRGYHILDITRPPRRTEIR
jgi:hypothetical protein